MHWRGDRTPNAGIAALLWFDWAAAGSVGIPAKSCGMLAMSFGGVFESRGVGIDTEVGLWGSASRIRSMRAP